MFHIKRILQTAEARMAWRKGLWFNSYHCHMILAMSPWFKSMILPVSPWLNLYYICKTWSSCLLLRELNGSIHTKSLYNPMFFCLLHNRLPLLNHIDFFSNFYLNQQPRFKETLLPAMIGILEAVANSKIEILPLRNIESDKGEKTHM